ncbi:hypothetical protein B5X24_HaOG209423 [Helicoverpa armigera]|uniref:Uncharacterized protein n=1 Tax=Helicoverpa armigera TaxID=29058 RepID=A0A2W1BIL5_HELAM|nr:hypothetical protein B5X24_HaOG209423 [Helicoverpa armigera]
MKGFLLFLAVAVLAYTYTLAIPAENYGNVHASDGSVASGVVANSSFKDGAFSVGTRKSSCGILQKLISKVWNLNC